MIEDKTRVILMDVLGFPPIAIRQLEGNKEAMAKTLGLIELVKQPGNSKEIKSIAKDQLKRLRQELTKQAVLPNEMLHEARRSYYSFG